MFQPTLILGLDLGTSALTSSHGRVRDSLDRQGKLHREKLGSVSDVKDWPSCIDGQTGNNCFPTDLIYRRANRELLFSGFEAQQYLDDPFHDIPTRDVFVVETIKLLLPDPDEAEVPSAGTERYRAKRNTLTATLGKHPDEVFEDLLNIVLAHVLDNATRKYSTGLHNHNIELVLAFPSGWSDRIHTNVARIGARALQKAITTQGLGNMTFGIENVYTVSETICGVKEWLRETVAEASSIDFETHTTNLDELNEGDCFLPIDIGGGTGCLTPLKLISKNPLGVEQLDKTQSLEVSGDAVHAEFERNLRPRITKDDYSGDPERAIYQVCRKFKEEKKKCGVSLGAGSNTWNCPLNGLKPNPRKGFEKDCMKLTRKYLEYSFDPVIDVLDRAIEKTMRKFPTIKAIVFLGQFGGSSAYLKKRMASNPISSKVNIRYSQSGKLDVVKGAISERLTLEETFVRRFKTVKSYGTLVTFVYDNEVANIFPNPQSHGALPFELADDGIRLKVIEWAIPKETIVQDGRARDIGKDGPRHHTWPFREDELGFEDTIVVSEEDIPAPQHEGRSYTLWTEAHQNDQLYIAGERRRVQQIPFCWDLIMSQKLDAQGNIVGPYERDDLRTFWSPEKKTKGRRRKKFRDLCYNLIWEITEMQVKVYVQALFPNQVGPALFQLAKEQALGPGEKTVTGESRSKALEKDIEIANGTTQEHEDGDDDEDASEDERREIPRSAPFRSQQDNEHPRSYQQSRTEASSSNSGTHQQSSRVQDSRLTSGYIQDQARRPTVWSAGTSKSGNSGTDGRRRDGCYTCKDRKKKCDCVYNFDEVSGTQKCNTCRRVGIPCDMTAPDWAHDPVQREIQQRERKRLVKLGKRKASDESRDESKSATASASSGPGFAFRDLSATLAPTDNGRQPRT
ncbi:hypothetical protein L207DRAFT_535414 [Hyaloscypha variabilis F]|uniref:Zn(2)-C6 fungal-type domain-containing protein n=1 Tax=Hyaloscypha variabilis (strain UAMH 11265 / GT02V1 / F) TaxID=1149755 RepID=A0A2J6R4G3_HYAVF|nr:hypothetical protein L207DRAFT_535414 [Hyaloscypha variabilis F]